MSLNHLVLIVVLGGVVTCAPSIVLADSPTPQVQRVDALFNELTAAASQPLDSDALVDEAAAMILDRVVDVLEHDGQGDLVNRAKTELVPALVAQVREIANGLGRGKKLADVSYETGLSLVRAVTSSEIVYAALDSWFEVPTAAKRDVPGSSADGGWDAVLHGSRTQPARLIDQLSVRTQGPLELDGASTLAADTGGPGADNGVMDAGEWVKFHFVLTNTSAKPLFSSSAWLRTNDGCIWVDSRREYQLAEMLPGTGSAVLDAWAFLASDCGNARPRGLDLVVYDTHELASTPQTIALELHVYNAGDVSLEEPLIDVDLAGSSDGQDLPAFAPGRRYELSLGLRSSDADADVAVQSFEMSAAAKGVFETVEVRLVPMQNAGAGHFLPGDDLDLHVKGGEAYDQAMENLGAVSDWYSTTKGGRLWVAVDTVVARPFVPVEANAAAVASVARVEAPRPAAAASRDYAEDGASLSPRERRRSGNRACDRVPNGAEVAGLVKGRMSLVPRPAQPRLDGAVKASDVYEIVFDRAGFVTDYEALVGQCLATAAAEDTAYASVRYRYRHYMELGLPQHQEELPALVIDLEEPEIEPEPTLDPVAKVLPVATRVRLDLAGGWAFIPLQRPTGWSAWPRSRAAGSLALRGSYGTKITGVLDLSYASFSEEGVWVEDAPRTVDFVELAVGAGIGYVGKPLPTIELQPRLVVGVQYRKYEASSAGWLRWQANSEFGITSGLTVRKLLTSQLHKLPPVALLADIAYSWFGDSPPQYEIGDAVADGSVLRLMFGLTVEL